MSQHRTSSTDSHNSRSSRSGLRHPGLWSRCLVLPAAAVLIAPPLMASTAAPPEVASRDAAYAGWELPTLLSSGAGATAGSGLQLSAATVGGMVPGVASAIPGPPPHEERFLPEEFEREVPGWDAETGGMLSLPGGLALMHPVPFSYLSSPFGWRDNPTGPGRQFHFGQDYPAACGTPVRSAESGVVESAGWHDAGGWRMVINHGHGVKTAYSHNEAFVARIGQTVERGEVVAISGTTGRSTGCHVHFEVLLHGEWVNPALYLPGFYDQPEHLYGGQYRSYVPDRGPDDDEQDEAVSAAGSSSSPSPSPEPSESREAESPSPSASPSGEPSVSEPTPSSSPRPSRSASPQPSPEAPDTENPSPSATPSPSPSPDAPPASEDPAPTESPSPSPSDVPEGECAVLDEDGELLEPEDEDYEEFKALLPAFCE